mmetsp:Transcript_21745/g.33182  ORF Transcript_21745/g.33182 Transcript_21745/m.33182 type:complete len:278 (+) Transcript_21745:3-836(+)
MIKMATATIHFVFLVVSLMTAVCQANSSYSVYNYDIGSAMFTPDGRILQTEYALLASSHSLPMVILPLEDGSIVIVSCSRRKMGQSRIVQVVPGVIVAMSGILPDCVALLQKLRSEVERQHFLYGDTVRDEREKSPTQDSFHFIAKTLGDACQEHAMAGGIRPYGATMVVVSASSSRLQIIDSSGAVKVIPYKALDPFIHGGKESNKQSLHQRITNSLNTGTASEAIRTLIGALSEEMETGTAEHERTTKPSFEVVIATPTKDILRMSAEQIKILLN